jgi:2-oxo-4-hydroxy-4-carboxy-5-ureidoimidazoline decarboxylase
VAGEAAGAGRVEETGRAGGANWSDEEQRGAADADGETRRRLADANREYEARFGYIFIVCATGRTAAEMLALLEGRLRHDAGEELQVAAEEQRRITQLRLRKLLEPEPDALS